jgi:hypothetical protein
VVGTQQDTSSLKTIMLQSMTLSLLKTISSFLLLVAAEMAKLAVLALAVTFGLQPSFQRMSSMRGASTSIVAEQMSTAAASVATVGRSVRLLIL